jgi:hypothetical protein
MLSAVRAFVLSCFRAFVLSCFRAFVLSCFRSKQVPHEVDGFLLVNQVRQTYPNIDVTLTSTAAGADESEFRTIGKPWHLTVLLVRIQFGDM